jgi:hypothetical protein
MRTRLQQNAAGMPDPIKWYGCYFLDEVYIGHSIMNNVYDIWTSIDITEIKEIYMKAKENGVFYDPDKCKIKKQGWTSNYTAHLLGRFIIQVET